MNESILKALMQMFAIVATVNSEGVSADARKIVESYLKLQLSQPLVDSYLALFDKYLEEQSGSVRKHTDATQSKRNSRNSVKVLKICNEINEALQQYDKIIVVIRLLEFVSSSVTDKELDFIDTVADTFNIPIQEYNDLKSFVLFSVEKIEDKTQLMIYSSQERFTENYDSAKKVYEKNLRGHLNIFRIKSTNLTFLKYKGEDDLYLNSSPIVSGRTYLFGNGAVVKSPKINPIYYSDVVGKFIQSEQSAKIVFRAKDIEFHYANSDNGIHKFSFYEESGNLIGIMGGSGVGKSTLLNLLIGNYPLKGGKITINGYDFTAGHDYLKGVIGYVPQDDLLMEELTVFQNLYFNAKLCFSHYPENMIVKTVNKILLEMDLLEIKDLKVGDPLNKFISGGQRKRLNIALELIREPSVLIVDEPTSGLSSADSEMVMTLLKEQTIKGKLVIVNIHQPSSDIFKMFDKILVMDRGGYPAYYGNPLDAIMYFKKACNNVSANESECPVCGNVNPEQVLEMLEAKCVNEYGKLTRNRKISPKEWYGLYNENIAPKVEERGNNMLNKQTQLPDSDFHVPGLFSQFKIFVQRNILSKLADRQYLLINLLESPLLAFLLAFFVKYFSGTTNEPGTYIFANNENIPAYIFICVICAMFIGLTVSAEEIIRDLKILKRERFLNLSWSSYINSKVAVLFGISAIQTLSFALVGNFVLEIKGLNFQYWIILFSVSALANMIGLNISSGLKSVVNIYITIPFIIVPQLLFSGVLVNFGKMHKCVASSEYVPMVGDAMPTRWAFEALALSQFRDNEYFKNFYKVEQEISRNNYMSIFLIPNLEGRINSIKKSLKMGEEPQKLKDKINIVYTMVSEMTTMSGEKFDKINDISVEKFNDNVAYYLNIFLDKVKSECEDNQYNANIMRDKIFAEMVEKYGGREKIYELQEKYHNKKLEEYVLNKNELEKVLESDGRLVQQKDPAYQIPRFRNGRAHFYAPVKRVGNLEIDTFVFNIMIMWIINIFFYITLRGEVLKKILNYVGRISFKKKKFVD
ncbi:MAG: ATP-binding cassette domain-containing protein [Bacteroidales bacterium]|nr:ATP-binding cassette domain-containing protein [Bacteroidales bacterium]